MKKWQAILGTMVAVVMVASVPMSALAQRADEAAGAGKPPLRGSLAIVAPHVVPVDREMSLGVFQRENQEPVPGAGVWALTRDNAEALRKDNTLKDKIASAEDADQEALFHGRGTFLGRTGGDGRLFHTFKEAGDYVLVAAKKGYVPDFSPLVVRGIPANALVVKAPKMSPPGESVTITVTEKVNGEPVKDAGVWALTRENAEALKSQIAGARPAENSSVDLEATLNGHGIFLGTTNGNGELKYTFEREGVYVLVAFKKGYLPGLTGIAIKAPPRALSIHAPRISPVGESVTMKVTQRGTEEPVKDAGIWALTTAEAEALKAKLTGTRATDNVTPDIESIVGGFGVFLGKTHGNGELKYTFDKEGRYILVAAKNGYIPGYTGIAIVAHNTTKPSEKPNLAPRANDKPNPGNGPANNATANNTRVK